MHPFVEQILAFFPLFAGLCLMAGLAAWVFIHSNRSYRLRWALIPAAFLIAAMSSSLYPSRLGYAVAMPLPEKFVYLGHHVVVVQNQKVALEVWGQTRATRLYVVPYSKPMERALEQAQQAGRGGEPVVMHRRQGGAPGVPGKPTQSDLEPYESNIILPEEVNPKQR